MNKRTKKYTSRTLKALVMEARAAGIDVSFNQDMDSKYIVSHRVISTVPNRPDLSAYRDEMYTPESCATAHWLIWGMMGQAKSQLLGIHAVK